MFVGVFFLFGGVFFLFVGVFSCLLVFFSCLEVFFSCLEVFFSCLFFLFGGVPSRKPHPLPRNPHEILRPSATLFHVERRFSLGYRGLCS